MESGRSTASGSDCTILREGVEITISVETREDFGGSRANELSSYSSKQDDDDDDDEEEENGEHA